jgi:hypothetical protein
MRAMFRAKVKVAAAVAAVMVLGGGFAIRELAAGEPADKAERKGPLAALPSAPGAHLEKIKALGDNQWLNLGAPAADPKWGRALGCAWGGKSMVLAPELRGAFRTGEGCHAYVKPDGFGQDDYWFYDINAHRWICLYPGTDTKNFNRLVKEGALKVDDGGQVVDSSGQPIPGHLLIHAFGYIDYDTDAKKFAVLRGGGFGRYFMPGLSSHGGNAAVDEAIALLEGQGLNKKGRNFAPWAYNTQTGRFERDLATNAMPDVGGYFPLLLYIPSKKQFFAAGESAIAFFNPATRTWSRAAPNAAGFKGASLGCYDSKRDRVYVGHGDDLYCYDVKTSVMTKGNKSAEYSVTYDNNSSALVYDSTADKVLCLVFRKFDERASFNTAIVAPLDPETNNWGTAIPFDPAFKARLATIPGQTNAGFYDPELGVTFVYSAGDSRDDGGMWVYKFKSRAAAAK